MFKKSYIVNDIPNLTLDSQHVKATRVNYLDLARVKFV